MGAVHCTHIGTAAHSCCTHTLYNNTQLRCTEAQRHNNTWVALHPLLIMSLSLTQAAGSDTSQLQSIYTDHHYTMQAHTTSVSLQRRAWQALRTSDDMISAASPHSPCASTSGRHKHTKGFGVVTAFTVKLVTPAAQAHRVQGILRRGMHPRL